jgi:glycerate-2-kinase
MSIGRTRLTDIVADVGAIAADTDGIDGSEDNAGAVLAPGREPP